MTSRRRNLFVILLMLGLLVASAVVIVDQGDPARPRPQGRRRAGLPGRADAPERGHARGDRPRDRHHARARRPPGRRGARDPAARQRPDLGRPAGRQEPRAREEAGRHDRPALPLRLGDATSIGSPHDADQRPVLGRQARLAATAARSTTNNTTKGQYYLFKPEQDACRGPGLARARTLLSEFDGRVPKGYEVLQVPPGTVVLQAREAREPPGRRALRALLRRARQPGAARHRPQGPAPGVRPDDAASRSSPSSSPTRAARTSRRSRSGSPSAARPSRSPASRSRAPSRPSRSCSTARSSRGRSSTTARTRTGIDGRTGAQISGGFNAPGGAGPRRRPEDRRAADRPEADQRDAGLRLARQAGAAPGPDRGRRRLRRSCCSSCSLFYRLLGVIAGVALFTYAVLFFGADQADPDHAHAARHRGTDPHDRGRGRYEHRHLRTHQGGAARRADRRCRRSRPATSAASRRSSTRTSSR